MSKCNIRLIKTRRSYTPAEIARLFGVNRKTVSRWFTQSLMPIKENTKPLLVTGAELKRFLTARRQNKKVMLQDNEYYCLKCHKGVTAKSGSEQIVKTGKRIGKGDWEQTKRVAKCIYCETQIQRFLPPDIKAAEKD